jgi:hypothetical protein
MPSKNPRNLLIAKQFFIQGKSLAAYGDNFSAMKSVLFLDLAVETMLNVLIQDFGSDDDAVQENENARDDMKWRHLWRKALGTVKNANVMQTIPHYKDLQCVHEMRNLTQHCGVVQNPVEVSRRIPSVERMLTTCFDKPYGLNFVEFQLLDEIRNPDLKRLFTESQQELEGGNPMSALRSIEIGFQVISAAIKEEAAGGEYHVRLGRLSGREELVIGELEEILSREINMIHDNAVIANLGISMAETGRYRKIRSTFSVYRTQGGWHMDMSLRRRKNEEDREDASFSLNYMIGLALLGRVPEPCG